MPACKAFFLKKHQSSKPQAGHFGQEIKQIWDENVQTFSAESNFFFGQFGWRWSGSRMTVVHLTLTL